MANLVVSAQFPLSLYKVLPSISSDTEAATIPLFFAFLQSLNAPTPSSAPPGSVDNGNDIDKSYFIFPSRLQHFPLFCSNLSPSLVRAQAVMVSF